MSSRSGSRRSGSSLRSRLGQPRRQLVHVRRQVGEEAPGAFEGLRLRVHGVVDRSVRGVDAGVAELLLGHHSAAGPLDQGRSGDHHLGGVADDDRVVRRAHAAAPMPATEPRARDTDGATARCLTTTSQPPELGDVGAARHLDRLDRSAAAHAVDQTHVGSFISSARPSAWAALGRDRGVGRAAAHGEVVAGDDRRPAVDLRHPEDEVRGPEGHKVAVVRVLGAPAISPTSWKLPESLIASMRSRTVSLPK